MNKALLKNKAVILVIAGVMLLYGCGMESVSDKKIRDLQYETVEEEEIPEEVYEKCLEINREFSRMAYIYDNKLYVVVCYGPQPTTGYRVEIDSVYETEDAIVVETTLKGPESIRKESETVTYPYAVISLEKSDKYVVFN